MTNKVLDHALQVEVEIERLRQLVLEAGEKHGNDVRVEGLAAAKVEHAFAAYSNLSNAMEELATSKRHSLESSRLALSAKKALRDYTGDEQRKTRRARSHG
ncbi:MAG: hypothetical protein M3Z37_02470 [Candidatus Eremiobacteraeota bacterium]|nr:hypothetical protein [Candidatus Eremiobacteraeota bacterium]